jgi:hypothetical protein
MSITAAFWSNGPNWPSGGEIDITEGVHDYTTNQFTIHTDPGCKLTSSVSSELGMAGTLIGGPDCAVASTSNQGCGIRASDNKSFGAAYNANGGGVYVMRWDAAGVAIWFFQPDKVPADLTADAPRPETWQKPEAIWAATNCDPKKYFYDHHAIFDTTLWYVSLFTSSIRRTDVVFTVAIGPKVYGIPPVFLVKSRAVLSAPVPPPVWTTSGTTALQWQRLVSTFSHRFLLRH